MKTRGILEVSDGQGHAGLDLDAVPCQLEMTAGLILPRITSRSCLGATGTILGVISASVKAADGSPMLKRSY